MRDKFSELIAAGVASFEEKPIGSPVPELDPMVRLYNGLWGLLTDTHMSKVEDGYIITGRFVQLPLWNSFIYSGCWGTTNIKLGSGYYSLDDMVRKNGYCMVPDIYNGDNIIRLKPCPEPESAACPCGMECPVCCSVGESNIPHPLSDVFSREQINEFVVAWIDAKGDANKIIENLQTTKTLDGSKFRISSDNKYLVGEGNKTIKFELNHAS